MPETVTHAIEPVICEKERRELLRALLAVFRDSRTTPQCREGAASLILRHGSALLTPRIIYDPGNADARMMREYWDRTADKLRGAAPQ